GSDLVGSALDRPPCSLETRHEWLGRLLGKRIEHETPGRVVVGYFGDQPFAAVAERRVVVGDVGIAGEEDDISDPPERDERIVPPHEERLALVVAGDGSVEVRGGERPDRFGYRGEAESLLDVDAH